MPIKPENKILYPPNWKDIRAEVLGRDGHKCKFCGLENYSFGCRVNGLFLRLEMSHHNDLVIGENSRKIIQIVLTIAHLNHNPTDNGEPGNRPNLAALCQKCHLTYDAKHHAVNARVTRDKKALSVPMDF